MVYALDRVACHNKDHLEYWNSAISQCCNCRKTEFNWKKFSTILEIASDSLFKCDVFLPILCERSYITETWKFLRFVVKEVWICMQTINTDVLFCILLLDIFLKN